MAHPHSFLARIADLLIRLASPHGQLAQTQAVYALSDDDLAARGIKHRDAARQIMINGDWT